jgi:hypothetical protein
MKKNLFAICATVTTFLLSSSILMAQNSSPYWSLAGNSNATSTSKLGTTNNISLRFYTNNAQRMIINSAAGLVGIGTTSPTDKLHINSPSGTNPLRVQVNGSTKLRVSSGGGVSIGSSTAPPSNGLYVSGNTGIGTSAPESKLHVFKGSAGSVTADINAPLIVENSTHAYINMLVPDAAESGILFGKPASNVSGGIIYSSGNDLQFRTNGNINRMILDRDGNLGIGADPGDYKTKISHTSALGIDIENESSGDDWELYVVNPGGNLYLYYNTSFRGQFNSTSGAYGPISDERLKTNIRPMTAMLEKIKLLKPSTYQFKNAEDKQDYNGFIAQDVMKIFPAMATHNVSKERNLDVYTLDYSGFGVLAIKGIQELQSIIEEQKKINGEQQVKITTLEERIMKLEAALATITASNNENIYNGSLEQNKPNPFNKNTTIRYSIPQGSKGQINIYDQAGKLVKAIKANANGRTELSGYDLAAGTYAYALMINGKAVTSKQMLIIK